ncbi:cell division protein FtsZ, partial [Actinomadura rugatobispora]
GAGRGTGADGGAADEPDESLRLPAPRNPEQSATRVHAGESDSGSAATGQRRRPVVFDEDDDLDVPDFLK